MPFRYAAQVLDAATDGAVDRIDVGSGTALLQVYTGSQPATPGDTATGTLLAEFELPNPCFGGSSAGVATAEVIAAVNGLDTGDAGWFRALNRNGDAVWDFAVGDGGVTLNTNAIVKDVPVSVSSWTFTSAAS